MASAGHSSETRGGEMPPPGASSLQSSNGNLGEDVEPKTTRVCVQERKMRSLRSQQRRIQTAKKTCEHCGVGDDKYKLRVCSGCNLALYCSAACQKAASGGHRRICDIISILPPQNAESLLLLNGGPTRDFDACLRYATKHMDNLKNLGINIDEIMRGDAVVRVSAKQLSSLLRSKKGELDSVSWASNVHCQIPGISNGCFAWKELHGVKQLRFRGMKFYDVQPLHDIIHQQRNDLVVLCLHYVGADWHKAKCRRSVAQVINSCKHLVKLELKWILLMDSDLKIMLHGLPSLRILDLTRYKEVSHEFTDNTCGLIARKCPGLQALYMDNHDHLSMKGIPNSALQTNKYLI
ncbi:hypothetical protein ACHAXT_002087 [Thalassiosira profunda]